MSFHISVPGPRPDFEFEPNFVPGVFVTAPMYWCSAFVAQHRDLRFRLLPSALHTARPAHVDRGASP